jgi:hypothetical protein
MMNPFKIGEMRRLQEQQQQQAAVEQTINYKAAGAQESAIEEQNMIDRRNALIQLSQWQQDRSEAMQNLFLKLAGYYFDKKEGLKPIHWDTGYVSLYGAQKMVSFIESLDRNVMLGNWSERNVIITLREAIAHPLRRFIFLNHNEIELTLSHAEYVFWLIMNTVEPTYWRGYNNGERRKDSEIIKIEEHRHPDFRPTKKTVFGLET